MSKSMPKGAKPFDLQKALAGEKVITRDGREVKCLRQVNFPIQAKVIGRRLEDDTFSKGGKYLGDGAADSRLDLFMAPKTKTVWINLYLQDNGSIRSGMSISDSEDKAKYWISEGFGETYLKTISLEIPDED